jgi:hypothetical protein
MNWLNELPAADPRRALFFNNAIQSIASGHQAAERLAILPATARTDARQVIEGMTLPEERRALMLKALEP